MSAHCWTISFEHRSCIFHRLFLHYPYVIEVSDETDHSTQASVELRLDLLRRCHSILSAPEGALNRIKYVFDWAVDRIIRSPEHAAVAGHVNGLLHEDIPVRVQVIHGEDVKVTRRALADALDDAIDK